MKVAIEAGIATLTLERPAKRNALDAASMNECIAALSALAADAGVRVAILTGAGTAFCAGIDLDEPAPLEQRVAVLHELLAALTAFPKPVIAAVNGAAAGAGAGLALACDRVILAAGARMGFPELAIGRVPALMVAHLVQQLGRRRALAVLLDGQLFEAQRAMALGLADEVVADGTELEAARTAARNLAELDPALVAITKRLVGECADLSLLEGLRLGLKSAGGDE